MQFTTVRSKEKDYDIYLKSEKLVNSQQEHEKNVSQLFGSGKNWFLAISNLTNTVAAIWNPARRPVVHNCQEQGKRNIYLKSVHSQQEPSYLEVEKTGSQLFRTWEFRARNTVAAIWKEKKVEPCCLETKKCSSQLLGARKKIITSI